MKDKQMAGNELSGSSLSSRCSRWEIKYCTIALMMIICVVIGLLGSVHGEIGSSSGSNNNNLLSDINPKYKIRITENVNALSDVEHMDIVYMNFEKELHRCHIPIKRNTSHSEETVKESLQEKTERIKKEIVENIFPKFIGNCYFRIAGWWLYEFCFNKFVRQFHQEQHTVTNEYFLGYSKEQSPSNKIKQFDINFNEQTPEESYISIPFEKGTPCDLTNQPRTLELRMYCATDLKRRQLTNPNAHAEASTHFVGDIEEPATCSYSLKFYSNHLCKLEGFSPKKDHESDTIFCIPESVFSDEEREIDLMKVITEESDKILSDINDDPDSDVVASAELIGGEDQELLNKENSPSSIPPSDTATSTPEEETSSRIPQQSHATEDVDTTKADQQTTTTETSPQQEENKN